MKGFFNTDVEVFLANSNDKMRALKLWFEGIYLIISAFKRRQSFVEPMFREAPQKYSYHFASTHSNRKSIKVFLDHSARRIEIQYKAPLLNLTVPIPKMHEVAQKINLRKLITESEKEANAISIDNEKEDISNFIMTIDKLLMKITLCPFDNEPYKTILRVGLAFNYPTNQFSSKAFSAFVYPSYEFLNREVTSGGMVVFWKGRLPKTRWREEIKKQVDLIAGMKTTRDLLNNAKDHALRSAVAAIMARNMSHIHGSHIEPGLQHKMQTFDSEIVNRLSGAFL
jgi:hypothetical protein